jgi:glycosyltransferase involved in cell wall biosynthesis
MSVDVSRFGTSSTPPRFSVITVSYNAMASLPATVASLREQAYKAYEWVVIDGASTDGSVSWLKAQTPDYFSSEPDSGIYDAMNKAVTAATGEWLFFLNAGDQFADPKVLADIAAAVDKANAAPSVVYGDVMYFGDSGKRRRRFNWLTRKRLLFGDLCHQATFVRRDLFGTLGAFDTTLRYNADFDWLIKAFQHGARLQYVPRDIALFHDAGAHVLNREKCEAERNVVRARYCQRPLWLLGHWALRLELRIRRHFGKST